MKSYCKRAAATLILDALTENGPMRLSALMTEAMNIPGVGQMKVAARRAVVTDAMDHLVKSRAVMIQVGWDSEKACVTIPMFSIHSQANAASALETI